ncbi:hypothetical protein LCGC14_1727290 [marine sediment metagenome]|uniref:Uncharacterized protein n=1 Tax=marine sediment metagenome TaxID=412755 RepID=A0A0F9KAB9_9ZZZZ
MNIDEAIEILEELKEWIAPDKAPFTQSAIELGIEALKRVQAGRPAAPSLAFLPLPLES